MSEAREKKLRVLARIAEGLNGAGIMWAVGASLLLYFSGLTDDFRDIDLMVAAADAEKAEQVLDAIGQQKPLHPLPQYATKRFIEYTAEGVDIDMIAGFAVISEGKVYDCDLQAGQTAKSVSIYGQSVPLHSLRLWKQYYALMGRREKVALLEAAGV